MRTHRKSHDHSQILRKLSTMRLFYTIAKVFGDESLDYEKRAAYEAGSLAGRAEGYKDGYDKGFEDGMTRGRVEAGQSHANDLIRLEEISQQLRVRIRTINLACVGLCLLFLISVYCGFRPSPDFSKWFTRSLGMTYFAAIVINTILSRGLIEELRGLAWKLLKSNRYYFRMCSDFSRCIATALLANLLLAVTVNIAEVQNSRLKWELLRFIGDSLRQLYSRI
jgi:hypothetical protein